MTKLSIVIPVYNEEKTIINIIKKIENVVLTNTEKEIIIIDDCSTDGTRDILKGLENKYKIFYQEKNQGKGSAVRIGFEKSSGDIILIQDADLEYDPNEYQKLLQPILDNKADVVYGSRFAGGQSRRALLFWHSLGNKFLTNLSNMLSNLNLSDMETCYKIFTRQALDKIFPKLKSKRFGIEPEITALVAKNDFRIYEVGISYNGRTYKEGKKINWKDGLSAIWCIFKFNLFNDFNFSNFVKSKFFILFALALINLFVAYFYIRVPFYLSGDSDSYLKSMQFLQGAQDSEIPFNRLLTTPLFLYSSILASHITGSLFSGMMSVNIFLYFLSIYFFFKIVSEIYESKKIALISSVLFAGNYGLYNFGTAYTADMGGWFFFILGTYFAIKYFKYNKANFYYLTIFSAGIGILFKEYGALAIISLVFLILFSSGSLGKKAGKIIKAGLLFLIIPIAYYIFFYLKFGYSYFDWYLYAFDYYKTTPEHSFSLFVKVMGWVFLAGWPLVALGLWEEKKYFLKKRFIILSSLLPASLIFLAWPALTPRLAFIIVPWLSLLAGFGLSQIKNKYAVVTILTTYIFINYSITPFLIKAINLPF